jgi:capsid assembly protease
MERSDLYRLAQAETWAIWPQWLNACLANVQPPSVRNAADEMPESIVEADLQAVTKPGPKSGRVVRVPMVGSISRRESMWTEFFGGVTVEGMLKVLRGVAADDTIGTVLLDMDSPGGSVSGISELAAEVRSLRDKKHVVALANNMMASAAYWIGSQADELIATPDALVGSVGVFVMHEDYSAMNERVGLKVNYITAGKYKAEANPDQPLSDEARSHLQSIVDSAYDLFVSDVAKGRGVTASDVRKNYGEGRVLSAKEAKAAGMIDRVASVEETLRRLSGLRAEDEIEVQAAIEPVADDTNVSNSLTARRRRLDLLKKI